jgi:hypothetical protein
MRGNTFVIPFVDREHDPIRIHAENVQAHGDSYAFLENRKVVAIVPRNIVRSTVEEC